MARAALAAALRLLILVIGTSALHLAALWAWDVRLPVSPPLSWTPDQGHGAGRDAAREVTVLVGGDTALTDAATTTLVQYGYEHPLSSTVDLLRGADVALVNLETAVTERHEQLPLYKRYVYKMEPRALEALTWAGIDGVTLANNHVLDYGRAGLLDTLRHVHGARLVPIGAAATSRGARRGAVFRVGGARIGVLSYLEDSLMHSVYVRSFATGIGPGCARLTAANAVQDIRRLRRHADVVIVVPHWGRDYGDVSWTQRWMGRHLIDSGADAVVGHGAHVPQPVAVHRGRPILYGIGNYAFGTPGRESFRHGLLARLVVRGARLLRVELVPLLVQNRLVEFRPERLGSREAAAMLAELDRRSRPHGARIAVRRGLGVLEL